MEDAILKVLNLINELVLSMSGDKESLFGSFGNFMPDLYEYSSKVMENVIMPVAYVVLSLFFLLELYKASMRLEGAGLGNTAGADMIFRVLVKMGICKVVVDETPEILAAIFNLTTDITSSIKNYNSLGDISNGLDMTTLTTQIEGLGPITGIPALLISFITFLIVAIATLIANIIIITRFVELYIYLAISPIPIATLPHEEMSQIGKNFLKSFAAICVQGIMIFLVLSFFPIIFNSNFMLQVVEGEEVTMGAGDIYLSLLQVTGYAIVLIMALFSTGKWAKSICGAM